MNDDSAAYVPDHPLSLVGFASDPVEEEDYPCECGGQGWCRECREWAADHGYEDWS